MPDTFQPEEETLPPITELEAIAEVAESDVDEAVKEWKADSPDEQFKEILEAEE